MFATEIVRHLFDPEADEAKCADIGLRKETLYRAMVADHGTALLPGVERLLKLGLVGRPDRDRGHGAGAGRVHL